MTAYESSTQAAGPQASSTSPHAGPPLPPSVGFAVGGTSTA